MTLRVGFPTFNWFQHDVTDCPSLVGFCDHCTTCGVVVERYTEAGVPTCEAHCGEAVQTRNSRTP
jgi:hypothetical protein